MQWYIDNNHDLLMRLLCTPRYKFVNRWSYQLYLKEMLISDKVVKYFHGCGCIFMFCLTLVYIYQ